MATRPRWREFLDERAGLSELTRHALDEPVPGGARWAYVFGKWRDTAQHRLPAVAQGWKRAGLGQPVKRTLLAGPEELLINAGGVEARFRR